MRNRCLLGAGVALAVAFGCAQAHAQFFGPYPPGAFYLGPEGGWTHLTSQNPSVTVRGPNGICCRQPGQNGKSISTAASTPASAPATCGARGASRGNTATGITMYRTPRRP